MIVESDYRLPHAEQPKHEPTDEEKRHADETLEYLEALPWRPHGVEW
jgi:hypothetical protein